MSEALAESAVKINQGNISLSRILNNSKITLEVQNLALEALKKHSTPEKAAKHIIGMTAKACASWGALTIYRDSSRAALNLTLDGIDWTYSAGLELKMVLAIALLMGHELNDEEIKVFLLEHFTLKGISMLFRNGLIQFGTKSAIHLIDSIPSASLQQLTKLFGHRVVTKRGKTGDFNLIMYACLGGMALGASYDWLIAYSMGYAALHAFQNDNLPTVTAKELNTRIKPEISSFSESSNPD